MASNKQHILTLLVLFSFFVGFSQITSAVFGPAASEGVESFPCLQNLAPCQPYLKGSYIAPAICCEQLKVTINNDLKCLCDILTHTDLLKTLNITQVELMKLPKECGIDIKQSACKGFSDLLLSFLFLFLVLLNQNLVLYGYFWWYQSLFPGLEWLAFELLMCFVGFYFYFLYISIVGVRILNIGYFCQKY